MFSLFKPTSQTLLEFSQIKQGVVILKNGSLRGILLVSSINFDLKSEEEQKAIIFQFQNFLNSLDFSCQILVQSRRLNITGYLDNIKQLEKKQTNELLKIQTREYQNFIKSLLEQGTIMKKQFFVIVPFTISEAEGISGTSLKTAVGGKMSDEVFNRCRDQLWQRMEFVAIGLRRCDLTAVPLTTPEIIELFWSLYHPKEAESGYYPEILPELLK